MFKLLFHLDITLNERLVQLMNIRVGKDGFPFCCRCFFRVLSQVVDLILLLFLRSLPHPMCQIHFFLVSGMEYLEHLL